MIDREELMEQLTEEDIVLILDNLGSECRKTTEKYINFRTICHNEDPHDANFNLVFYPDTKLFYCFSECGKGYNIYSLIRKRFELLGEELSLNDAFFYITDLLGISVGDFSGKENNLLKLTPASKYTKKDKVITLPPFDDVVLEAFQEHDPIEWLSDGISHEALRKYNIRYSGRRNQIIIPHYDADGNLVGVRGRHLKKENVEKLGKYLPITVEGKRYSHSTSLNLYGLNLVKENIKKQGLAIIAEGEKSCMQAETFLGAENNIVTAVCGNAINKWQIILLLKICNVKEVIIAFDKEEDDDGKYYNRLMQMARKYSVYCNMSFIYDRNNLLQLKESPFDRGLDVFNKLIKGRIKINANS